MSTNREYGDNAPVFTEKDFTFDIEKFVPIGQIEDTPDYLKGCFLNAPFTDRNSFFKEGYKDGADYVLSVGAVSDFRVYRAKWYIDGCGLMLAKQIFPNSCGESTRPEFTEEDFDYNPNRFVPIDEMKEMHVKLRLFYIGGGCVEGYQEDGENGDYVLYMVSPVTESVLRVKITGVGSETPYAHSKIIFPRSVGHI